MGVLETFYILFQSDADKAAAGLKKVDDAADDAEKSLQGADRATKGTAASAKSAAASATALAGATSVADTNAKRLATSFLGVAKALAAPLAGLLSANVLTDVALGRAAQIRELDQFSAKLNSTIGDVDAFQRAIVGMGGESTKALDSLVKIGEKVNEAFADKDSGARKDFEAWGLSFQDAEGQALGATDAMLALAESLESVSRAEGLARIKKLGIEDAATIELLLKGRTEVERYMQAQKDLGVVTEEQAETTREYYAALGTLGNRLTSVGNSIAATILPALTQFLDMLSGLVQWATENQHLVEGFFMGAATAITAWLLPAMVRLALATLAATWPWLLLAAAIAAVGAAFALAWEDFKAWQEGQPSLLGELLGSYEDFTANLQALFDALNFEKFMKWISDVAAALAPIIAAAQMLAGFAGGGLNQSIVQPSSEVPSDPTERLEWFKSQQGFAVPEGVSNAPQPKVGAGAFVGQQSSPAANAGAAFGAGLIRPPSVVAGQSMLNGAASAPQGLAAPTSVTQTSTVNVGQVTVNTQATDAQGMAAAAKQALTEELRGTAAAFDDGVDK